eukprot:gene13522-13647_t
MSKRKGLSLEEKRDKVLEVFTESADVFVLKDVEKLAAKKGVVLQTIKEVLQSLVDDGLVHQEKIGSSNYFWSFPAEQSTKMLNDIDRAKRDITAATVRQQEVAAQVQQAKQGKEDSYAREAANRWQDNVFALQSWCRKKFEGREGDVDTFFKDQGFNEDAEYFV